MNNTINNFLLIVDKFMPKMYSRQPGFTYSAGVLFTKNETRIRQFKETRDYRYICRNKLDKFCSQHDMDLSQHQRFTSKNNI